MVQSYLDRGGAKGHLEPTIHSGVNITWNCICLVYITSCLVGNNCNLEVFKFLWTKEIIVITMMKNQNDKDVTDANASAKPRVKQIIAMFDGMMRNISGPTAVDKEGKPLATRKLLLTGRNYVGDSFGNTAESGPNKHSTKETFVNPATDDTPTKVKEKGGLLYDPCLASDNEIELGCDMIEEGSEMINADVIPSKGTVIDGMNYLEIGKLMESLNMNATSMEKDKENLKRRLFSGQRIHSYSQQIKGVFNTKVQTYKSLTQKMLELCCSLIATVQNESFKTNMSEVTNKRFPDYETELESIKTVLQNMTEEFEIVVTGETSSGKSTFLNVLIGDRILPSHHLHTTASLCRLHNSENKRIKCIVKDRTVDNVTLMTDSSDLRRKLESMTKQLLSEDGDDEPLKVIDIYWPISSLHENVVLVDTPGIGERDALTKQVVDFVPKCAGYIFVVDSSRAGGVQDSGIRKLLEAIAVSASNEEDMNVLSNAIFVCNKWDLVPKQDREAVLEDTKRKIRKHCGQLKDWQIVQFNADLDLKLQEWKANPTDSFKMLLESLDTLMIRAIETRLRDKYRWLQNFIMAVNGLATVRITAAELSKEKVQLEMKTARTHLDTVAKELEKCSELEVMLDQEDKSLLQDLEEYLKSADTQKKYFDWTSCVPEMWKLPEIGPSLIKARIQDAILEWGTADNGSFKQASVRIADNCTKLQSKIDSRIGKLNNLELGFSFFKHSGQGGSLSSDEIGIISSMSITIGIASSPIWMKVARVVHVINQIPGFDRVIDRMGSGKKKIIEQMRKTTTKAIDTLVSENRLKTFITDSFTSHYSKWLTALNQDAAHIISSTRACMICIEKDLHKNIDTLQVFKTLQAMLNECSNRLHELDKDF